MRAATVEISADRDFAVYADGEHLTDLPATLQHPPGRPARDRPAGPSSARRAETAAPNLRAR